MDLGTRNEEIMDLTIETKEFVFCLDGIALALVSIYIEEKLKTFVKERTYYLTKKEVSNLILYLNGKEEDFHDKRYYMSTLNKFKSMHMLMLKNEKAMFKFW